MRTTFASTGGNAKARGQRAAPSDRAILAEAG
jgi:hypothetical protein